MEIEMIMTALLICSILTTLVTEAIKKMMGERHYSANLIAAIVSVILAVGVSAGYIVYTGTPVTPQIVITVIAIIFLSWLSAMLGYDKVKQAVMQIGTGEHGND